MISKAPQGISMDSREIPGDSFGAARPILVRCLGTLSEASEDSLGFCQHPDILRDPRAFFFFSGSPPPPQKKKQSLQTLKKNEKGKRKRFFYHFGARFSKSDIPRMKCDVKNNSHALPPTAMPKRQSICDQIYKLWDFCLFATILDSFASLEIFWRFFHNCLTLC